MNEINPPAITRSTKSERIKKCKALEEAIKSGQRMTLETALEQGKELLALQEEIEHGEWLPLLETIGISRQRAAERIAIAKCPAPDISKCDSISDALRLVAELAPSPDPSSNEAPPMTATPKPPESKPDAMAGLLCRKCAMNSKGPVKDCPGCADKRKAAKEKAEKERHKNNGRTEGGDEEAEATDKERRRNALKVDAQGLPKDVANALADTWHLDNARLLAKIRQQCKSAFTWSVFLDGGVLDALKLAEEYFLAAAPKKKCPECKGMKKVEKKNCQKCRAAGYLAGQV